jgi:hypothetical protein
MRQERLDLPGSQRARVGLAVEDDEASNPIHISLLGADAVVLAPDVVAHAVEQARRSGRLQCAHPL